MNKKQWENVVYYHKWHMVAGVFALVLAWMLVSDFYEMRRSPDYQIGLLVREAAPTGLTDELELGFESILDDRNGDGTVSVNVIEYVLDFEDQDPKSLQDIYGQSSNVVAFTGDYKSQQCMLYLCKDVAYFQEAFGVFANNDGSTEVALSDATMQQLGFRWDSCDPLRNLPMSAIGVGESAQAYMKDFRLLLRCAAEEEVLSDEEARYYQDAFLTFSRLHQQCDPAGNG